VVVRKVPAKYTAGQETQPSLVPTRNEAKTRLRRSLLVAIVHANIALAPTMSSAQLSLAKQTASHSMLKKAWSELYRTPRDSLRIFETELPKWATFSKQSGGYIDADRGSLIAAVVSGDDLGARTAWSRIQREAGGVVAEPEPPGDLLAWKGDWASAFRSYRDAGNFGTAECTTETNRGLDEAILGELRKAIETWSSHGACSGPFDLTDVHLALTGDALAAQDNWSVARSTWIQAARKGRVVPQIDMLYRGNVMALSMLYHFRSRLVAALPHTASR